MTDITELAQREKFEAWVMTQIYISKSTLEGLRTADGYRNSTLSGRDYNLMWNCWKAAGAELVEALEKAQAINAAAEKLVRCKGRYHSEQNYRALAALFGVTTPDLPPLEHENVHYADAAEIEIAALRQRIAELEESHAQVIQSRDHYKRMTEEGLKQLAESRTVTVKLPQRLQPGADGYDDWYVHSDDDGEYLKVDDVLAMLTAAGIKWEGE